MKKICILCNEGSATAQTEVSNVTILKFVIRWLDNRKECPFTGFICEWSDVLIMTTPPMNTLQLLRNRLKIISIVDIASAGS